jgi:hypothetical protein
VRAQAFALHYHSGLPLRQVPQVIAQITGIQISQSALTQSACTLTEEGGLLAPCYDQLRQRITNSPVVNTDDTGWRVNATLAFVMGFFTAETAYYQIRPRHRADEVLEVIDPTRPTMMGTDRGKSYEARVFDEMQMQKCISHLLKNLSVVEETKTGRAKHFATHLKSLLREGLELWQRHRSGELSLRAYRRRGKKLDREIEHHLRHRILTDIDGIGLQHDRGRLTLFLSHPEIEPTNNRAERGLRPAVIARKVSHCSKNERGARAYAVLKSIFVSLSYHTKQVTEAFADLLRGQSIDAALGR